VILLSTKSGTPESLGLSSVVDAVVVKPITTERLQPVIDHLIGLGRN
jgi:AmiR/NasT family two-component response regulator